MKPAWLQWVRDHVRLWTWRESPKAPTVWGIKFTFPLRGRASKKDKANGADRKP
jgi:hypothetical protein